MRIALKTFVRVSTLFLAVLLLSCNDRSSDCVAEKHPAPPPADELAEVSKLAELKALKPIHLETGWDVRLALSDGTRELGPWRLLYCYATYPAGNTPPSLSFKKSFGEAVGPVFLRCRWDALEREPDLVKMSLQGAAREGLYCGLVLLAWDGECRVEVLSREGKALQSRVLTVKDAPPCYWQVFAGIEFKEYKSFVRSKSIAAYPLYDGLMPRESRSKELGQIESQLSLTLEKGVFEIQSQGGKMIDWPDYNLLARWWVNDKPVLPRRGDSCMMMQARKIVLTERMQISFGFPDDLGELKEGDKLRVQVLYCPSGYECLTISNSQMMIQAMLGDDEAASAPLLSNVLELVMTKELLAARKREPVK